MGTIFSFGPENSGFNGATPANKNSPQMNQQPEQKEETDAWKRGSVFTLQPLDGPQLLVFLPVILLVLHTTKTPTIIALRLIS